MHGEPNFGSTLEGGVPPREDDAPIDRPDLAAIVGDAAEFFGSEKHRSTLFPFGYAEGTVGIAPGTTVLGVISMMARRRGIEVAPNRDRVGDLLIWSAAPQCALGEENAARLGGYISMALRMEAARFTLSTL